jgi:hypothetical protein
LFATLEVVLTYSNVVFNLDGFRDESRADLTPILMTEAEVDEASSVMYQNEFCAISPTFTAAWKQKSE